jgi:flagellin
MIINHNMMAMNTHRQMSVVGGSQSKSMEKLSSGQRINRAGDDAAGLAISEKMKGQIRGLNQASRNAQDGISLVQTAEGALQETQAILQRMRELAVQASNDTYKDVDREKIQKEVDQLSKEITRISENTEFNQKNVLNGDFVGKFHIGANEGQDISLTIGDMSAKELNVLGKTYTATTVTGVTGLQVTTTTGDDLEISFAALGDKDAAAVTETTASLDPSGSKIVITLQQAAGDSTTPGAAEATDDDIKAALESIAGDAGIKVSTISGFDGTHKPTTPPAKTTVNKSSVIDEDKGINVSSQPAASAAITTIQNAIEKVSEERSKLGATQNRLEHTIKNLDTSSENLQAAESRIRDVDMAKEMMEFTKNNILQQAAQSMLAQANQAPQGVLQLLR